MHVGWYRISQEANEGIVAAAVFEVVGGGGLDPSYLESLCAEHHQQKT